MNQLELVKSFTPDDWNTYLQKFARKKDLEATNWIFKTIGLVSLPDYLSLDVENIFNSFLDPTQANKTKFVLAVNNFQDSMKREILPKKFLLILVMWVRSRRMEKLLIQLFTHLHSYEETEDFALELYRSLKRNNAYNKTLSRFGNTNHTIEGIESIINSGTPLKTDPSTVINNIYIDETSNTSIINNHSEDITNISIVNNTKIEEISNTTINHHHTNEITNVYVNQDLSTHITVNNNEFNFNIFEVDKPSQSNNQTFQFAVFPYIHRQTSKLDKVGQFLEKFEFIRNKDPFISLFVSSERISEKVVWNMELAELCFLIRALMVFEVISKNEQFSWAKKTSQNFVSVSSTKSIENIKSRSLATISSNMGLSWLTLDDIEDWVNRYNSEPVSIIYQELNKLYR